MKYTIDGFDQKTLCDMGLDIVDTKLLRYIVDFYHSGSMAKVIVDDVEYFWVKYGAVIKELPILNIQSKVAIARRFDKLVACGLLEKVVHKQGGTYTCFRFTKKYDLLVSSGGGCTQKYNGGALKSTTGVASKVQPKDPSTNDPSTKNQEYSQEFLSFWNSYPNKTNKKGSFKNWKTRIKAGVSPDLLIKCAKNYAAQTKKDKTDIKYCLHAATFLGPQERYEDYTGTVSEKSIPMGWYVDPKTEVAYRDGKKVGHYDGGRYIEMR